jgi:XTP/dITP diphosphohydrolase
VKQVVYACSTNPGKLGEFSLAAREWGSSIFVIVPLPELAKIGAPDETGQTFEENAVAKAAHYSGFSPELVLADDSGLEVAALGGDPGVYSARFAGKGASDSSNNDLLLKRLRETSNRDARFVCVLALARAGTIVNTFRGTVEGLILREPRGANGFGYDPLFLYPPLGCSFGELDAVSKFRVSHRGDAVRKLCEYLSGLQGVNQR